MPGCPTSALSMLVEKLYLLVHAAAGRRGRQARAGANQVRRAHAVDHGDRIAGAAEVGCEETWRGAGNGVQDRSRRSPRRQRVEHLARVDPRGRDTLHIHNRWSARHRDHFLDATDAELRVDRRGEIAGHLDAFTANGPEPVQRERHHIRARPQIHDAESSGVVGDDGASLLDERSTRSLDAHSRQHRAARVGHRSSDRLCRHRQRKKPHDEREPEREGAGRSSH